MNGKGFAFFRWRVMRNPHIGDDVSWWAFWLYYDQWLWLVLSKQAKIS
jgi:hypothetical protein